MRNHKNAALRLEDTRHWLADRLADNPFLRLSASLYSVNNVRVTAILEDMVDFFSYILILLLIPQLRNQVVNNISVTHQMQPEVFVVKHTANVRIIEYTLLGSLNRIALFLNNFFEDIDLCCRSIFLVIN